MVWRCPWLDSGSVTSGSAPLTRIRNVRSTGRDTARPELAELLRFARDGDSGGAQHGPTRPQPGGPARLVQSLTRKGVRVEFVKEHMPHSGTGFRAVCSGAASGVPKAVLASEYGISTELG